MKWLLVLAFVAISACGVKTTETVYMKRSEIEDQATSASGYAYQVHSGGPLSYTTFARAPANLNHFGYPPITLGRYTQELPPQLPLTAEYKPQTPLNVVPLNSYGYAAHPAVYASIPAPLPAVKISAPVAASNFEKGGGSSYSAAEQKSGGEKASSGYKSAEEYDKGSQGKHENEGHKGFYSKEGGNKAGHHEVGAHYGKKEEAAKGSKGASFSHSSGHKKGSKTTGYHRVHHKNEYKKDHSFYDESDTSGHFNKHGDFDSHNSAENGAFHKGGHEEGAYQAGEHGAKGFSDKGRYVDQDSGYKGEQGKDVHYKDFQQYAKQAADQAGKEHGYSRKDLENSQY